MRDWFETKQELQEEHKRQRETDLPTLGTPMNFDEWQIRATDDMREVSRKKRAAKTRRNLGG